MDPKKTGLKGDLLHQALHLCLCERPWHGVQKTSQIVFTVLKDHEETAEEVQGSPTSLIDATMLFYRYYNFFV